MIVALRALPVEVDGEEISDFKPLGEALLMMSDLVEAATTTWDAAPDADTRSRELERYVFTNGLFHVSSHPAHVLARSYDLYLTDRPHLRGKQDYTNLPKLAATALGVDADTAWAVFFAMMSSSMPKPGDESPVPFPLRRSTYFSKFNFSEVDVARFMKPIVVPIDELSQQMQPFNAGNLQPYNLKSFLEKPLVQIGDLLVPVEPKLVMEKLGRGLHFLGLDNTAFSKEERARYLTYIGDVFEDEVHQILERIYRSSYTRLDSIRGSYTGPLADGLLLLDDMAVVVECKAKLFSVEMRASTNPEGLDRKLDDIVVCAARQVHETVAAARAGKLAVKNYDRIVRWYPLVISLERMPLPPMLYKRLREDAYTQGFLVGNHYAPLQVVDIDDLEYLEQALLDGEMNLAELLRKKVDDPRDYWEPFGNYLHRKKDPTFVGRKNARLMARFEQISTRALKFFEDCGVPLVPIA
jgi:hypothetical protein